MDMCMVKSFHFNPFTNTSIVKPHLTVPILKYAKAEPLKLENKGWYASQCVGASQTHISPSDILGGLSTVTGAWGPLLLRS